MIHGQDHTNELIAREHERTRRFILASIKPGRPRQLSDQRLRGFTEGSESLGQEEKDFLVESLFLAGLRFSTMDTRFEEIVPAHRKTFEWIFQPPEQDSKWSDFPRWLSEGVGIYWINGKFASGKSTLMRFICEQERTATLLKDWSEPSQLIGAAYFFWNSGTPAQRSYQGLLRALLFKILKQSRRLIRVVFPEQWVTHREHPINLVQDSESWTLPRLIKAFEDLFREAGNELKFCLFVDGLDEFEGDPFDIINLFIRVSKFPNVKLCLSSRPLYDFVKMFGSFPTLRLQDLNFNDIKQYVNDELGANEQMQELCRKEPEQAPKLSLEILDKADGVFLWVKLAVVSLLRGLRYSDHVSDLQRRLRILPPSLEDLFSHILGRLEPVYLEQSSRIFQIFQASRQNEAPFTSLELSFAEEHDAPNILLSQSEPISKKEWRSRMETVDIWLVTRCGGLIEARHPPATFRFPSSTDLNRKLSYLHRTVRDFLELPQVWSRILSYTRQSQFSPYASLLKSHVLYMKLVLVLDGVGASANEQKLKQYTTRTLKYAYLAEVETNRADVFLLDELVRVMDLVSHVKGPGFWGHVRKGYTDGQDNFLALAISSGLYHYVAHKIKRQPEFLREIEGRPLLNYAIDGSYSHWIAEHRLSSKITDLLLRNGSYPSQKYNGATAWELLLQRLDTFDPSMPDNRRHETEEGHKSSELLKITRSFIQNGAIVDQDLYEIISRKFEVVFPEDTKELKAIMIAKGALDKRERSDMVTVPLDASALNNFPPTRRTREPDVCDVDLADEAQENDAAGRRRILAKFTAEEIQELFGEGDPFRARDVPQSRRRNWFRKLCCTTDDLS